MENCPVLSFLALFLELGVFLQERSKTISCQHASLMHNGNLGMLADFQGQRGKRHCVLIRDLPRNSCVPCLITHQHHMPEVPCRISKKYCHFCLHWDLKYDRGLHRICKCYFCCFLLVTTGQVFELECERLLDDAVVHL